MPYARNAASQAQDRRARGEVSDRPKATDRSWQRQAGRCRSHRRNTKAVIAAGAELRALVDGEDSQINIQYHLVNFSSEPLEVLFAIEFNLSPEVAESPNELLCRSGKKRKKYSLKDDVQADELTQLILRDLMRGAEVSFYFERWPHLWAYPLETVSASESGYERNYQQTVLMPYWPINLEKITAYE